MIGFLGEVHPQVLDNYGIGEKAYVAVLDMPKIVEKASFDRKYEGIPKFPAVTRDLSMVVPKHVLAGEIEEMIVQRGGKHLESFKLFDIYEGTQTKKAINLWLILWYSVQRQDHGRSRDHYGDEEDPQWAGKHGYRTSSVIWRITHENVYHTSWSDPLECT